MMRDIFDALIEREGGFADRPDDRGGPTKYGVTIPTLRAFRRSVQGHVPGTREGWRESIENLSRIEARRIYINRFYERYGISLLPGISVQEVTLDCAVLHGPRRAIQWLQRAVGTKPDGIIGPETEAAVMRHDHFQTVARITARRARFLARLVKRHPDQIPFLVGWIDRAASFIDVSG
jgi:lysozyme family protein